MRAVILQSDQRRLLQEEGTLAESCTVRRLPFGREQSGKEHFIEGTVSTKALRQETLVMCSRPRKEVRDFPGCPVVKNPPCNAGDTGSVPGRGAEIPYATGQLSLQTSTTEPESSRASEPQLAKERSGMPQLRADTAKLIDYFLKRKEVNKDRSEKAE